MSSSAPSSAGRCAGDDLAASHRAAAARRGAARPGPSCRACRRRGRVRRPAAAGRRRRSPVRRCRSSASLTRSRSSLIAAATVSSSARLRPLRLPRACASSASLGSCAPSSKVVAQARPSGRMSAVAVGDVVQQLRVSSAAGSARGARRRRRRRRRLISRSTLAEGLAQRRASIGNAPSRSAPATDERPTTCAAPARADVSAAGCRQRRRVSAMRRGVAVFRPGGQAPRAARPVLRRERRELGCGQRHARAGAGAGSGRSRSGENSTLSLRPVSPRAGAQFVEQRQQHDRDVAVAALQAFEVIGQLHDAAHQRRVGLVAIGDLASLQRAAPAAPFPRPPSPARTARPCARCPAPGAGRSAQKRMRAGCRPDSST